MTDWQHLAHLVTALLDDDSAHRDQELWRRLEPLVVRWVRAPSFLGRVADDEDLQREIVVRTWIKLAERDRACLRAVAADPPLTGPRMRGYLYRVVKNLGTDYLRSLPEYVGRAHKDDGSRWYELVEWTPELEVANDNAAPTLAHRMLDALDEPSPGECDRDQRRWHRPALWLWSCGYDDAAIAAELGLRDPATAERVVGAAKERLRRRYRAAG